MALRCHHARGACVRAFVARCCLVDSRFWLFCSLGSTLGAASGRRFAALVRLDGRLRRQHGAYFRFHASAFHLCILFSRGRRSLVRRRKSPLASGTLLPLQCNRYDASNNSLPTLNNICHATPRYTKDGLVGIACADDPVADRHRQATPRRGTVVPVPARIVKTISCY